MSNSVAYAAGRSEGMKEAARIAEDLARSKRLEMSHDWRDGCLSAMARIRMATVAPMEAAVDNLQRLGQEK